MGKRHKIGKMVPIAGRDVLEELDPSIWEHLPNDMVKTVLSKLPFPNLITLRLVAKFWRSDIIPCAAQESHALRGFVLLYSGSGEERPPRTQLPLWFIFFKSDSYRTTTSEKFVSDFFPLSGIDKGVRLVHSEDGLLFYGYVQRATRMMSKLVVSNPLMGHRRMLMLPRPIQWGSLNWTLLVGVLFDANLQDYRLVIAGLDKAGILVTFVYSSASMSWTSCPCILPEVSAGITYCTPNRGVCCKRCMYWCSMIMSPSVAGQRYLLLKFDFQQRTWPFIPFRPWGCLDEHHDSCQIISHGGQILLWHLHMSCLHSLSLEDGDLPCRHPLTEKLPPEIKLMQGDWIEKLCALEREGFGAHDYLDYFAFKQGSFIYHAFHVIYEGDGEETIALKIVTQNVEDNSFSQVPMECEGLFLRNFWSFTALLTALP